MLGTEILTAVRLNADKALVGGILGLEALGIYYFVFNAGYGLSLVLTSALASSSYPYFADPRLTGRELVKRFDDVLFRLAVPVSILIMLQALAVFIYVPVLFGAKWEFHTPLVALFCITAVTKPAYDIAGQLLRAAGMPAWELVGTAVYSALFLATLAIALPAGLMTGIGALAVTAVSGQIIFASWARQRVINRLAAVEAPRSASQPARADAGS